MVSLELGAALPCAEAKDEETDERLDERDEDFEEL